MLVVGIGLWCLWYKCQKYWPRLVLCVSNKFHTINDSTRPSINKIPFLPFYKKLLNKRCKKAVTLLHAVEKLWKNSKLLTSVTFIFIGRWNRSTTDQFHLNKHMYYLKQHITVSVREAAVSYQHGPYVQPAVNKRPFYWPTDTADIIILLSDSTWMQTAAV